MINSNIYNSCNNHFICRYVYMKIYGFYAKMLLCNRR